MILNDLDLMTWAAAGGVAPYNAMLINPASIDLCLDDRVVWLNTGKAERVRQLVLSPGQPVLASTVEYIKLPPNLAGLVLLKSSWARQGLDHALAGWVDPGFEGDLTLELHAHRKIIVTTGMAVVQLVVMRLTAPAYRPYGGKYQGQTGPTVAR